MFKTVLPLIKSLFHAETPSAGRLMFRWRLVQRQGRPLMLLPLDSMELKVALELYSAQRLRAKVWRSTLPALVTGPCSSMFPLVSLEVDKNSEMIRFISEQSRVPTEQLRAPAIKFGGLGEEKVRLSLLVCDQTNRPAKVIKVGIGGNGQRVTESEAELLEQLPPEVIGCIRMSGRYTSREWSAFATPFFLGKAPENDAGMELLFHSWLNLGEGRPITDFELWNGLEKLLPQEDKNRFVRLTASLAGKQIHTTLYHGDFTPWNIRAVNSLNLQAYDWEGGSLQGIPGWDWFHFIIQTAILVKRYSPQRVAAELDQLIQSPRFVRYARAAGIDKIVQPLLLGYLLYQEYVVRPLQGREATRELFELLWHQWEGPAQPPVVQGLVPVVSASGARNSKSPFVQVRAAIANLFNLFWHPSLTHEERPTFLKQLERYWTDLLASLAWIVCVAQLPLMTDPHLMFAPFYLVPCIYMALRTDRRLSSLVALASGFGGPLLLYYGNPHFASIKVILWNGLMRYIVFQIVVVLFDRIRRQGIFRPVASASVKPNPIQAIAGNWAVIAFAILFTGLVMTADYFSGVNTLMTGLYIIPCMIATLALGWRWGTLFAVTCSIIGPVLQLPDPAYQSLQIQFWNTAMRLVMYEMVVFMIDRVRRKSILFSTPKAA